MSSLPSRVLALFLTTSLFYCWPSTLYGEGREAGLRGVEMDIGYKLYDQVLQRYVNEGKVDYLALRDSHEELDRYLSWLAHTDPDKIESTEKKLAFWINTYNALVLKGVLDTLPERPDDLSAYSVKRNKGFFTRKKFLVGERYYSLDEIENDVLRPMFKDPRVHFAIVCASLSCPILESKAFRAEDVQNRLEEATKRFLASENRFKIDRENKIVYLSPLFRWFKKDFEGARGSLYDFVADYLESEEDKAFLQKGDFTIEYLDYDWSLNIAQ